MDETILDFYKLPNIGEYEDLHLMALSEHCAMLEEKVYNIAKTLPPTDRQVIEGYIIARNDLDVETIKTAMRWGKEHCK